MKEQVLEDGFGNIADAEVPEYEQLRQQNLRKNALRLQQLGVPLLAASLTATAAANTRQAASVPSSRGYRKNNSLGY